MNTPFEDTDRNTAITDIEFLARSVPRIDALCALAERPRSRTELRVLTGASASTVYRLLGEFENRTWVVRDGHHYRTTELGGFVAAGFVGLIDRMETERTLREMMQWLSVEPAFDIDRLADADITRPTQSDPLAPMTRAGELVGSAARARVLTHSLPEPCFVPQWQAVTSGTQRCDLVITADVIEAMAGPACAPRFRDVLDADRASVFVHHDDLTQIIGITDGVVFFGIDDERGAPVALIETENETVVSWAEGTFESYRREARPLASDAIEA